MNLKLPVYTSIFVDPDLKMIEGAVATGTDRIELYTEAYAQQFSSNKDKAIAPYREAAQLANTLGLGVNAGHDLSQRTLLFSHKKYQIYWKCPLVMRHE